MMRIWKKKTMELSKIKIMRAEPCDAERIAENYRSLIGEPGCTWDDHYPTLEFVRNDIEKQCMFKAVYEGRIIGSAYFGDYEEREVLQCFGAAEGLGEFGRVGVIKEFHRMGVAERLLRSLLESAPERGFDRVALLVGRRNLGAAALYEKLGFERVGESELYDTEWYCYLCKLLEGK